MRRSLKTRKLWRRPTPYEAFPDVIRHDRHERPYRQTHDNRGRDEGEHFRVLLHLLDHRLRACPSGWTVHRASAEVVLFDGLERVSGRYDREVDADDEIVVRFAWVLLVGLVDECCDSPSGVEYGAAVEELDVAPRYPLRLALCTTVSDDLAPWAIAYVPILSRCFSLHIFL